MNGVFDVEILLSITNFELMCVGLEKLKEKKSRAQRYGSV